MTMYCPSSNDEEIESLLLNILSKNRVYVSSFKAFSDDKVTTFMTIKAIRLKFSLKRVFEKYNKEFIND